EGAEEFAGRSFHSARWDHAYDLAGKRVAVVGTGASAVQLIPEVVERVARLWVFQRTGNWMLPRKNRRYPPLLKAAIKRVPALQRANVGLITDAIARLDSSGIVTSTGARLEVDCIIWATGFRTTEFMFPMQITTSTGLDLREAWAGGAHAHFGITVPGFPNM